MSAKRRFRNRSQQTNIRLPIDLKPSTQALLSLLDAGDEELLELLERKFLPLPPKP